MGEYWLVDPENDQLMFYRLTDGEFEDVTPAGETFRSAMADGFALDIKKVKEAYADL